MDVIARCAFGFKIDTIGSENDVFIRNARVIVNPPTTRSPVGLLPCKSYKQFYFFPFSFLNLFCTVIFPNFLSTFGGVFERLFSIKEMKFFFNLLEDVLRDRSQSKEVGVCLQNYVHPHIEFEITSLFANRITTILLK